MGKMNGMGKVPTPSCRLRIRAAVHVWAGCMVKRASQASQPGGPQLVREHLPWLQSGQTEEQPLLCASRRKDARGGSREEAPQKKSKNSSKEQGARERKAQMSQGQRMGERCDR